MLFRNLFVALVMCSLTACQSTENTTANSPLTDFPVVTPKQLPLQYEQELAQLNILLAGFDSEEDKQAYFLYRRAVRYDQIGLHRLAERDFSTVVKLVPQFADAYLHLGIYALNRFDYEYAYQHFDSVLELAPDNHWAYLNRGIALYYGARYELAVQDFETFEREEPSERYTVLWKYLALNELDEKLAQRYLQDAVSNMDESVWVQKLGKMLLGELSSKQLFKAINTYAISEANYAELLCEAYFYLGKRMQYIGDYSSAQIFFTLATTPNVNEMVEHRLSLLELKKLEASNE